MMQTAIFPGCSRSIGGLGPEGKTAVFCPRVSFGLNCPICDELDRIWKAKPDDATKEWLRKVGATPRHYVNIIDLNDLEKGVQAAEFPKTLIEDVWKIISDPDAGYGDITDWDNGYDLIVDKSGVGLSTRYDITVKTDADAHQQGFQGTYHQPGCPRQEREPENLLMIWQGKSPAEALPAPEVPQGIPSMTGSGYRGCHPGYGFQGGSGYARLLRRHPSLGPQQRGSRPVSAGSMRRILTCLDCLEQDDCEMKMVEEKRAARAAAKAATAAASTRVTPPPPPPIPAAAPATPPPAAAISEDDLMAEMRKGPSTGPERIIPHER